MSLRVNGKPSLLRQINQANVLAALRGAGVLRVSELAERTGLSRPTVSHVLEQLQQAGWIAYLDQHPDARRVLGRPARLVRFRPEAGHVLGLDIGPHHATVVVADLDGHHVAIARRATSTAHSGPQLLAKVRATIRDALNQAGMQRRAVLSVAAGSPGIIDRDAGAVTFAPGLPGWTSLNLRGELRRSFRCPVHVENDVNLAVLGERAYGVARDAATVVFVLWGERVGAGLCINGQLHRGATNAAGEIGYLTVLEPQRTDARPDPEGRGPFEQAIGAGTIAALARDATAQHHRGEPSLLDPDHAVEAADVFAAAAGGDPIAGEVLDKVAARLARGIAPLLLIVDPDLLVLGGGLSRAGAPALEAVEQHLRPLTLTATPVRLSALAENAVALGAVRLALTDVEQCILPRRPAAASAAG